MYDKWRKIFPREASLFAGVLFVAVMGFVRPFQQDMAHVVSIATAGGGRAMHPAHFELGKELFGKFTLFLTTDVIPPVAGDMSIELTGPEALDYKLTSRYPPAVPILNRGQPWFRFLGDRMEGVNSGDDLIVVAQIKPPSAPGEYELKLTDAKTQRVWLTVPILFEENVSAASGEECH